MNSAHNSQNSIRYSDQKKYYLNHLQKQLRAKKYSMSILGKHHNNLDNFIKKNIGILPASSRILDARCGLRPWVTKYLRKKNKIYGVDGEPVAIQICKEIYPTSDYRVCNLYNLNYKANQFDAVVMREVIEHTYNLFFGGPCKPYKDEIRPSKFTPVSLVKLIGKYFKIKILSIIDFGISQVCVAKKLLRVNLYGTVYFCW